LDWFAAVDIYCERTSALFWAEPVNTVSNLSFILAALWGAAIARARRVTSPAAWVLIVMAGLIGVGSFLFHTFANAWSELADTVPIWSFVAVFVLVGMRVIGGMAPRRVAAIGTLVMTGALLTIWLLATGEGAVASPSPDPLNGSGQYGPALLALVVFAVLTARRKHVAAPWIIAATTVFLVSLVLRTLDRDLCAAFPLGTHFLWHLFNGLMVGILLHMLIRTGRFSAPVRV
jgi:hypothetical protein